MTWQRGLDDLEEPRFFSQRDACVTSGFLGKGGHPARIVDGEAHRVELRTQCGWKAQLGIVATDQEKVGLGRSDIAGRDEAAGFDGGHEIFANERGVLSLSQYLTNAVLCFEEADSFVANVYVQLLDEGETS